MKAVLVREAIGLFRGQQFQPTMILLSSSVLISVWRVFGSQAFYHEHFADRFVLAGDPVATAAWYTIGMCFLLLGVVPALMVKFLFRQSLRDYGVQPGNWKIGLILTLLAVPVIFLISYLNASDETLRAEYPLNRHAGQSSQVFAVHAASLLFFYLAWELHFRGYLQLGLAPSVGRQNAVWIQVMASCLAHIGKPTAELFASIPAGMFWGLQAYRTQALWAGVIQHWLLGITLDYFISFGA